MTEEQARKRIAKLANAAVWCVLIGIAAHVISWCVAQVGSYSGAGFVFFFIGAAFLFISIILGSIAFVKALWKRELLSIRFKMDVVVICIAFDVIIILSAIPSLLNPPRPGMRLACRTNAKGLEIALKAWSLYNNDRLPSENWCDLLVTEADMELNRFICSTSDCAKGESSYAMNIETAGKKIAELPSDLVVLFECAPGWNQIGGEELLSLENHDGKGCIITFADTRVEFVRANRVDQLRWEIAGEVAAVSAEDRPSDWAVPSEKLGCGNLHKVSDVLYRGEQPTAEGFKELEKMGIKTVINLRSFHSDRDELKGTSFGYEHIRVETWTRNLMRWCGR